jgi:hypothetical protein
MHRFTDSGAELDGVSGVRPKAATAGTEKGPGVDRTNFRSCKLIGQTGAATGGPSSQSATHKLQHSDTDVDGNYVDFTGGAIAAHVADNQHSELNIDLSGAKQWIRAVAVVALSGGSSPTLPVSSSIVLGGASTTPAS